MYGTSVGVRIKVAALVMGFLVLMLAGCGAGSSSPPDWFYHWNCNGDSQCLSLNPTGAPSGTADEGPNESSCTELLQFAQNNWNIPPATDSCDQDPNGNSGGTSGVVISSFSPTSTAPGNNVTIVGSGFPANPTVTVNGLTCAVVSATSTSITCTLPAMGNFTGVIVVDGVRSTGFIQVFNHYYGVDSASNQTVAVGGNTTLSGSVDGTRWNTENLGSSNYLSAAASVGTGIVTSVAVGESGSIYTNVTGGGWNSRTSPTSENLFGVASSGTLFVAVGVNGTIITSPDGVTWTARTSHTTKTLASVAWCTAQFIAAGNGGVILTSPDGITWTAQASGTTAFLNGVGCSGSLIAVGEGDQATGGEILTSPDGITWTQRPVASTNAIYGVAWSGSTFVAVGFGGTIYTSPNGTTTWTLRSSGSTQSLNAVSWSSQFSKFVAVGGFGTILTSADGVNWTAQTP